MGKRVRCIAAGIAVVLASSVWGQQNVGIGTNTPHPTALLELYSTSKGLLIPRMTQAERDAISSPATGLLIYQTDNTPGFYYWNGTAWIPLLSSSSGSGLFWSLTGNAGTTAWNGSTGNFLGTTDAQPLVIATTNTTTPQPIQFWTNNTERVRITEDGKVGLGLTAPIARLQTQTLSSSGAVEAIFGWGNQGVSLMSRWPTVGFNAYYDYGATTWRSLDAGWTGNVSLDQADGKFRFETASAAATTAGQPLVHNVRMVLTSTGRLGIGTDNPQQALHVDGSAYVAQRLGIGVASPTNALEVLGAYAVLFNPAGSTQLALSKNAVSATASVLFQTNFSGRAEFGMVGDEHFRLKVSPDGITFYEAVLITNTSSPNVGIGTTAPTNRLHVVAANDPLRLEGVAVDPSQDMALVITPSGIVRQRSLSGIVTGSAWSLTGNAGTNPATNFLGTTDAQPLVIRTNNAERMRVTAGGDVGIGTSTPAARLQVNDGNVAITNTDNTARQLRLYEPSGAGTNFTAFRAQAQGADITYTLPASLTPTTTVAAGILQTDAGGNLSWVSPSALVGGAVWLLTGNAGTNPATNFLGTTDTQPLIIRVNNMQTFRFNTNLSLQRDAGGNARGLHAVDLQSARAVATQVASGNYSVIGGGQGNTASGDASTVSGGLQNTASGRYSTVGGGLNNTASGDASTVSGGWGNTAAGNYSAIPGGFNLRVGASSFGFSGQTSGTQTDLSANSNIAAFVDVDLWLYSRDRTQASQLRLYEAQAHGSGANYIALRAPASLTANTTYTLPASLTPTTTVAAGILQTDAGGNLSWVSPSALGSGNAWQLTGNVGTNPATNFLGTTDAQPLVIRVNNTQTFRFNTNLSLQRDAGGNARGQGAVDLQSARSAATQVASGNYSVIGGGEANTASGNFSTVGGGSNNTASGPNSTVGGGLQNTASGNFSTVGGGSNNTASGDYSAIPGGLGLRVGNRSFGFSGQTSTTQTDLSANSNIAAFVDVDLWLYSRDRTQASQLRLYEAQAHGSGANYIALRAPASLTANTTYTLPANAPATSAAWLQSDNTGNMTWRPVLYGTVSVDPPDILPNTSVTITITITGVQTSDLIFLTPPSDIEDALVFQGATVTGANTVTILMRNVSATLVNGLARTWRYMVIRP